MSIAIVLPAYQEEGRIGPALDELVGFLSGPAGSALPRPIAVLVVDDGSTDGTAALVQARIESIAAKTLDGLSLHLMSVAHGGKGAAVRAGMLAVDADHVIFADADMATPPDQLPKLLAALANHDVALGSRIQPDGSDMRASQPPYRRALGALFHAMASIWVVGPVKDTQCGFKGFTGSAAKAIFARQRIESIVFDVELVYIARRLGYELSIVPIAWADRRGSRMRARPALALRVAWDLLRIPFLHRGLRRAVRVAR